jgi:hypothetical protein
MWTVTRNRGLAHCWQVDAKETWSHQHIIWKEVVGTKVLHSPIFRVVTWWLFNQSNVLVIVSVWYVYILSIRHVLLRVKAITSNVVNAVIEQMGSKVTSLVARSRAAGARNICVGFADVTRIRCESGVNLAHASCSPRTSYKCCAHLLCEECATGDTFGPLWKS